MKRTLWVRPELREAIARAILDDESRQDGEHLYDGERVIFYCPMQAPVLPAGRPYVPVRSLLPADVRVPTVGDYLTRVRPGLELTALDSDARQALMQAYDADTVAVLAAQLRDTVELAP